ncbi:MAG: hypothetical protein KBT21_10680 [Treponema sp.]|nr:hypothetical protein [Candidatus Treponema merdequi]
MIKQLESEYELNETFFNNMIKMGIILPWDEDYMRVYHGYWEEVISLEN